MINYFGSLGPSPDIFSDRSPFLKNDHFLAIRNTMIFRKFSFSLEATTWCSVHVNSSKIVWIFSIPICQTPICSRVKALTYRLASRSRKIVTDLYMAWRCLVIFLDYQFIFWSYISLILMTKYVWVICQPRTLPNVIEWN